MAPLTQAVRLAAVVVVAVFVLAALGLGATPAAAHTELLQASPGPGQRAGGEIDFVDLAFLEPVSEAVVEVTNDGAVVPGSMEVTDGTIIRFAFDEPLASAGAYEVRYEMISFDLDETDGSFSFTFDPDAPQAQRIGTLVEDTGRNWVQIVASGVLILALAGLAFLFLARIEARRRLATASEGDGAGEPEPQPQEREG